jgi:hypothetical protein
MTKKFFRLALIAGIIVSAGCAGRINAIQETADQALQTAQSAQTAAENANRTANEARQAATGAQSTANQALQAAQAAQACCDATNQRVDRMFESMQPK